MHIQRVAGCALQGRKTSRENGEPCIKLEPMSDQKKLEPPSEKQIHFSKVLVLSAFGLVALGTVVYRYIEDWSWVDSFYFSVVTITTVGFGDLTPTTDGGKLFTVLYIVVGISIFTTYLNARLKVHAARRISNSGED